LERKIRRAQVRNEKIAARDSFMWKLKTDPTMENFRLRNKEIAARLAARGFKPPKGWGVTDFNQAYQNRATRRRLNTMISKAKPS
jgi:hypothetical protein